MNALAGSVAGSSSPEQAMLLERCRSVHTFGMRTPICLVFLDASLRVVRVDRAPPGRIRSCRRARQVLECHVGVSIRVGDVLSLRAAPGEPATRDGPGTVRRSRT